MSRWTVRLLVRGDVVISVDADSEDEATEKARQGNGGIIDWDVEEIWDAYEFTPSAAQTEGVTGDE